MVHTKSSNDTAQEQRQLRNCISNHWKDRLGSLEHCQPRSAEHTEVNLSDWDALQLGNYNMLIHFPSVNYAAVTCPVPLAMALGTTGSFSSFR